MGSVGGGSPQVVEAEKVVTPAVARSVSTDVQQAQDSQVRQKRALKGITSTYSRFASAGAGGNGSVDRLG